jgi:nucleotide-binding universal stress UspA family protein
VARVQPTFRRSLPRISISRLQALHRRARGAGGDAGSLLATIDSHQTIEEVVVTAFKKVLVAIDFGDASNRALELGIDVAKKYGASLTLVHAWEVPAYAYSGFDLAPIDLLTPIGNAAKTMLGEALANVQKEVPSATSILVQGSPWREILAVIEETKPDLVIMGTHGRRGARRALLGSVAEKIVRTSPSPVLTVHAESSSAGSAETT